MNYYTFTHEHRHGVDTGLFKSETDIISKYNNEEIAELVGADFESDRYDESFDFNTIDINRVVEIK